MEIKTIVEINIPCITMEYWWWRLKYASAWCWGRLIWTWQPSIAPIIPGRPVCCWKRWENNKKLIKKQKDKQSYSPVRFYFARNVRATEPHRTSCLWGWRWFASRRNLLWRPANQNGLLLLWRCPDAPASRCIVAASSLQICTILTGRADRLASAISKINISKMFVKQKI